MTRFFHHFTALPQLLLLWAVFAAATLSAQEGKSFYKKGASLQKAGKFQDALEQYDLAIKVSPEYARAFAARGNVKELMSDVDGSLADRRKAAELEPKEVEYSVLAAQGFLDHGYLNAAQEMCDLALVHDAKNLQVLRIQVLASLTQGDIEKAVEAAEMGLKAKKTTDTYFYHGLAYYEMRDYSTALVDFEKVIGMNYLYEAAYIGQAEALLKLAESYSGHTMQMRTWEKIVRQSTLALDLNPESKEGLVVRSKAYASMKDYSMAINDVSKVVAIEQADADVYWLRAKYYRDFGQYQNAINDLNRVLADRDEDVQSYLMRADCHSANLNAKKALKDLETAQELMSLQGLDTDTISGRIEKEYERLFEENRESDRPYVELRSPSLLNGKAQVSTALKTLVISGKVEDQSLIKSITLNGEEISTGSSSTRRVFSISVPITTDTSKYVLATQDIYGNTSEIEFALERTEDKAPDIELISELLFGDKIGVFEDATQFELSGTVKDESLIKNIQVNGEAVPFDRGKINPSFSATVSLTGVQQVVVLVEDLHGNVTSSVLYVKRRSLPVVQKPKVEAPKPDPSGSESTSKVQEASSQGRTAVAKNRLGRTWVIFIDNSNYREFPAVNSSSDEIRKMKKAFSSYTVHNTIKKKNMSKEQMDRFFKTELRDLVRRNKVNAVLVWYSGHGKYKGSKHYWIPVDAKRDNPYTYFDATRIKAVTKAYSTSVKHTMVVADAVGTDPSFYEMTR